MASATGHSTSSTSAANQAHPKHWLARMYATTFGPAILGAVLLLLALPPWEIGPLAWIAPLPWLHLVRREQLAGKKPYQALWLAGFIFWMVAYHYIRLPHWATSFGWVTLAVYFGCYLPAFVAIARVAVHQFKIPMVVAAPVVWTGLEFCRGNFMTGLVANALGHTQVHWTTIIQISDLFGAYGVSFLVMLVAACLEQALPSASTRWKLWPILLAIAALGATVGYGYWRLNQQTTRPGPRVGLLQGAIAAEWKEDPTRNERIMGDYFRLSQQAVNESAQKLDLVVWPETMFRGPLIEFAPGFKSPKTALVNNLKKWTEQTRQQLSQLANYLGTGLLVGIDAAVFTKEGERRYNAAAFVNRKGELIGRYDKMHRVLFGEYIPFAEYFPSWYVVSPLAGGGLAAGDGPYAATLDNVRYSAHICMESVVPHLIARQLRILAARNEEPDVLVNLSNDAWFRNSSALDTHLASGVFRAVEFRKPMLIAANSGLSAHIDSSGRVLQRGGHTGEAVIIAEVALDNRHSPYRTVGDVPSGIFLAFTLMLAAAGLWPRRQALLARFRRGRRSKPAQSANP